MKKPILLLLLLIGFFSCEYQGEDGMYWGQENYSEPYSTSGEQYNQIIENPFVQVANEATSTFSIDADGASYANCRRYLNDFMLPPANAVRTEEFINYFHYDYPEPADDHPISVHGELSDCPWTEGNQLLRIGIKGKDIPQSELGASNFVLLIDVSGSMSSANKLGLLKEAFNYFVDQMTDDDRIAIVTYAGSAGIHLESTSGSDKETIKDAIKDLDSGGSTAGAEGIQTAYEIALQYYIEGGNNRVILGTDGDFNVGISNQDELIELIEAKRESGIFLTVLGVGDGNYQEGKMEQLANHGNGTFEYIDNLNQAKKVFINDFKNFYTVAKDVKVQVEFNADAVYSYRLIGYENRVMENNEFEDDLKDAGEIGCNQTITALYEIVPIEIRNITNLCHIKFRYKLPNEETSTEFDTNISNAAVSFGESSSNTKFAASATGFAALLFHSEYITNIDFDDVKAWAQSADIPMEGNFEEEYIELITRAKSLSD